MLSNTIKSWFNLYNLLNKFKKGKITKDYLLKTTGDLYKDKLELLMYILQRANSMVLKSFKIKKMTILEPNIYAFKCKVRYTIKDALFKKTIEIRTVNNIPTLIFINFMYNQKNML